MKLLEYSIQEAMRNHDWNAAIAILASFFEIEVGTNPKIDIIVDPNTLCEICISGRGTTYTWCQHYGFSVWPVGAPNYNYDNVSIYTND